MDPQGRFWGFLWGRQRRWVFIGNIFIVGLMEKRNENLYWEHSGAYADDELFIKGIWMLEKLCWWRFFSAKKDLRVVESLTQANINIMSRDLFAYLLLMSYFEAFVLAQKKEREKKQTFCLRNEIAFYLMTRDASDAEENLQDKHPRREISISYIGKVFRKIFINSNEAAMMIHVDDDFHSISFAKPSQ